MAEGGDASPLLRLATAPRGGTPYLAPWHLASAVRLEKLLLRAQLVPRLTMSYDAAAIRNQARSAPDASAETETATGAKQALSRLAQRVPADCWGVLLDVCAFGKGLQQIEMERVWPRRSAKLVLRIGLDHLAGEFGLLPHVAGTAGARQRGWMEERLPLIARAGNDTAD